MPDAQQPTVFYQPGATIAAVQAASIISLVDSRAVDESHIVSIGLAIQNLIVARTTNEANIATLTTSSTNQLASINSLIASRTTDEASIVTLQSSVLALQALTAQDTTINSFWFNAFGGSSTNYDGSINQTAGTLAASMRVYMTNSRVTLMLYACLGHPMYSSHTAIFAQRIPSWAWPSTTQSCSLNVWCDAAAPGAITISPNGSVVIHPLSNAWGNSSGVANNICITYLI